MKLKRVSVALLAMAMLLTFSFSALADDSTKQQDQKTFKSIDERIKNLEALKAKQTKIEALKSELDIIRELHQKVTTLRKALHALNQDQLRPLLKQARQAKNYDAMLQSLSTLKQVKADLANIQQLTEQNKAQWESMRSLRESRNFDGAMTALKMIETNVQAKIDVYTKATTDMKTAIDALNKPQTP